MTTTLTLDKAGRVVLPKPVRDEMQLRAGDSLELESSEDRIVLRPRRGGVGLHQKQGIWVFGVGEPIPAGATDGIAAPDSARARAELHGQSAHAPAATEEIPVKWFFDTTVLVAALLPGHPHHARSFPVFASATRKQAACAAHSLAEAYSTFTRYPGKERMSAEAASLMLQGIEQSVYPGLAGR